MRIRYISSRIELLPLPFFPTIAWIEIFSPKNLRSKQWSGVGGCCGEEVNTCCCEETVETSCCCSDEKTSSTQSLDDFLDRFDKYTLAISAMLFQDAWNLDLNRLKQCYIHVVSEDMKLVPFCAYNLTNVNNDKEIGSNLEGMIFERKLVNKIKES